MFDISENEIDNMPQSVQMILKSCGVETLITCHHCGCVTEIGRRCDNCGRVV